MVSKRASISRVSQGPTRFQRSVLRESFTSPTPATPPQPVVFATSPPLGYTYLEREWDGYDSYGQYKSARNRGDLVPMKMETTFHKVRIKRDAFCYAWHVYSSPYNYDRVDMQDSIWSSSLPGKDEVGLTPIPGHVSGEAAAQRAALSRIHKDLQSAIVQLQGIVETAEAGKTAKLLRNAAYTLADNAIRVITETGKLRKRVLSSLKKGNTRERRNELSGHYLQYTYGVQPLFFLMEDAKAVIANPPTFVKAKVKGVGKVESIRPRTPQSTQTGNWKYNMSSTEKLETIYKYQGVIRLDLSPLGGLSQQLGFTPIDLLPALYELTPLSFLVDYVANVGDFITAVANSLRRVDGVYSFTTARFRRIEEVVQVSHATPNGAKLRATTSPEQQRAVIKGEYGRISRVVMSELPIPTVGRRQFDFGFVDRLHTLNALVLAESSVTKAETRGKSLDPQSREAINTAIRGITRSL